MNKQQYGVLLLAATVAGLLYGCLQSPSPLPPIPPLPLPETSPPVVSAPSEPDIDKYPCRDGPKILQEVDEDEASGASITFTVTETGLPISIEQFAEMLITKCSEQLSRVAQAAAVISNPQTRRIGLALQAFDQQKLDYMKWWLQNRRQRRNSFAK